MVHVATVITPREAKRLDGEVLRTFASALGTLGAKPLNHDWLSEGEAFDLFFEGPQVSPENLLGAAGFEGKPIDCVIQPLKIRPKKLFVADMDSTIIAEECIDEIAAELNLKDDIAPITEAAMRGELDFRDALRKRVSLLKGLKEASLEKVLKDRIHFNPGAKTLISTLNSQKIQTALVSGGFTFFTERLGKMLGFEHILSNQLIFENGTLSGTVKEPIVDGLSKREFLINQSKTMKIQKSESLALGDGANDIPMFLAAGFSLAYHGKPAANEAASGLIRFSDLTAVLFALGIPRSQFQ